MNKNKKKKKLRKYLLKLNQLKLSQLEKLHQ